MLKSQGESGDERGKRGMGGGGGGGEVWPWKRKKASISKHPTDECENRGTLGKTPLIGRRENPIGINLDESFTATKARENEATI